MIAAFIKYLLTVYNWQRIPRIPYMLRGHYDDVDSPERRIMARMGSRDPRGVKRALRRYGVDTVDELVALIEHQEYQRNIAERAETMISRVLGGSPAPAHINEIIEDARLSKRKQVERGLQDRLHNLKQTFRD